MKLREGREGISQARGHPRPRLLDLGWSHFPTHGAVLSSGADDAMTCGQQSRPWVSARIPPTVQALDCLISGPRPWGAASTSGPRSLGRAEGPHGARGAGSVPP